MLHLLLMAVDSVDIEPRIRKAGEEMRSGCMYRRDDKMDKNAETQYFCRDNKVTVVAGCTVVY